MNRYAVGSSEKDIRFKMEFGGLKSFSNKSDAQENKKSWERVYKITISEE